MTYIVTTLAVICLYLHGTNSIISVIIGTYILRKIIALIAPKNMYFCQSKNRQYTFETFNLIRVSSVYAILRCQWGEIHRHKKAYCFKSKTENSPKFNSVQGQLMLILCIYRLRVSTHSQCVYSTAWEYCFFIVHSVTVFGDTFSLRESITAQL